MVRIQLSAGLHCAISALFLLLATQCAFPRLDLSGPFFTNGQFQFTLNHGAGGHVIVESSPDMVNWTPVVTNYTGSNAFFPITVSATNNTSFFRTKAYVIQLPLPPFSYVLAAGTNINMNGNNLVTDSYDSSDTNLSTNGQYDLLKASTNGNVASVGGIVNFGGGTINGSLYLGPLATYGGSTTNVTGTIYSNYNLQFPDVVLPTTDANSNAIAWMNAPGSSSGHDFTTSGYYWVNNSGNITVEPGVAVTLRVTATNYNPLITIKGGITNSGNLAIYHNPPSPGGSATLSGNSTGGPIGNRPANFIYFGMQNVSSVTLAGVADFVGAIYAPEASLQLNGGGNIVNVSGSIVAGRVTGNGRYFLHFDESLLTAGPFAYYHTLQ
jgi:hypothetical protein